MPDQTPEARRLAEQHTDDRLKDARAQGKKDAQNERFQIDTQAHFDALNGSVAKTGEALTGLTTEVHELKSDIRERDRVNEALAKAVTAQSENNVAQSAKKLTRLQMLGIVAMALMGFGSLLVAIVQALGHA